MAAVMLLPLSVIGTVMLAAGGGASAGSGTETFSATRAGCSVKIVIGPSNATALPGAGCTGGGYWFSSWQLPSQSDPADTPQQLLAATDRSPWTVPLPTGSPCFYQVDFAKRSAPPGQAATSRTLIFSHVGQTAGCTTGATTTLPVTTTTPSTLPMESTTTAARSPGTTLPLVVPTTAAAPTTTGTGTTSTTAARLAATSGQSGSAPAAAPSGAVRSSGRSLAFTGSAVLMVVFVAAVLIAAGVGLIRSSRRSRGLSGDEGSGIGPPRS